MIARRFLLSKISDRFLSFIAWVSVVGVALGVLALTVVTSVINGFENELSRVVTGMNGDVVLYSRREPISDPKSVEARIRKVIPRTQAVTSSFVTELMTSGPGGVAGSVIEGFDTETLGQVTAIPRALAQGRLPTAEGEVALGYSLAQRVGAIVGSDIRLIIPFIEAAGDGDASGAGGASRSVQVKVVGLVQMGLNDYDSKFVFAPMSAVQNLLKFPGRVTNFKIKLRPGSNPRVAADQLTDHFGFPFRAKSWSDLNKNLLYAIELEKAVISIILAAIVIVAAFNVVSTLMMMIHDKTREIAILKAMGFTARQSFLLFCAIGVGMGIVGTFAGVGIGLLINTLLANTRLIDLPPEIYNIGFLPVITRWHEVGMIALSAVLISFVATLYPSFRVSTRSPLEGLRHE
jgi:lipoprotein-releasing system permease protein